MAVREDTAIYSATRAQQKYRQLLRPIGAYFDSLHATHLLLAESEEGFIWRCFAVEAPSRLLFGVIAHDEIPSLIDDMKRRRLGRVADVLDEAKRPGVCPYGYEELLRCLSLKLDKEAATSMMLVEDGKCVLLQFTLQVPMYVQMGRDRLNPANYFHEDVFMRSDVEALTLEARSYRGTRFYR